MHQAQLPMRLTYKMEADRGESKGCKANARRQGARGLAAQTAAMIGFQAGT